MDSGPWDSPNVESLGQTSNVATSKIFASQLEEILSELSQSTAVSPDVLSRLQQVKQGLEMEDQERSLKEDLERQREAEAQNEINQLVQLVSEYEQKLEEMGTENYQLRDAVEDLKLREQDEAEHRQQLANNRLQELHDQYLKMESDFEDKLKGFQLVEKRVQELEEQLYEKDTKLRELMEEIEETDRQLQAEKQAVLEKERNQQVIGRRLLLANEVNQDLELQKEELLRREHMLQHEVDGLAQKKELFEKECEALREKLVSFEERKSAYRANIMKEAKDNHLEDSEYFKDLQKMQKRDFSRPATRKGSFMSKSVLGMEKSHEQESNANDQKGTDGNLSCAGISTLLRDHELPDLTDLLDAGEFPYGSAHKSQDRGERTPNSFRRGAQTPVGGNPSSNAAEKDKGTHSRHRSQISVMVDLPERTPKSQDWSKPIVSISKSDPHGPPFAQTDVEIVDIHHYASGKSTPRHLNASDHKKEDVSIVKSAAEGVLPQLSMSENQNKGQQMLELSEVMNPRISFGGDQETHQSPKSICRGMADQPTETSQEKQVHSSSNRDNPFKMSRLNLQGTDKSVVTVKKTPRWYVPGNSDSEGHPNSMGTSGRQTKNFEEDRVDSPEEHKSSKQKNSKKSVKTASFDVAYPEGEHAKKGYHSKPKGHAERDSIESKQSFKSTKDKDQPARDETTSDHSKANSQDCMGGITQKCILI